MKVVINKCYGGFGLSTQAVKYLIKKNSPLIKTETYLEYTGGRRESFKSADNFETKHWKPVGDGFYAGWLEGVLYDEAGKNVWVDSARSYENRTHPDLIEVVERLGKAANGSYAELEIIEIPDGVQYEIDDYDGIETIHEVHRSWG